MSDRAFTLTMLYAKWEEPAIRCELFLRHLHKRRVRIGRMELLRDLLWFAIGLALIAALWFAVAYALISL